ncbi:MAG: flagellar hook-associated protein FlgK [Nitrospira sp.]|nr:flagellar hook-associated protein FlgK [Nitrospira sp.]
MGIYDIFDIGRLGIKAQQTAIQVTSHNIANINTDGYSRQEVVLDEAAPVNGDPGQVGRGVNVSGIRRKYDNFIEAQLLDSKQSYGNLDLQKSALAKLETMFYDSQGTGINNLLDDFFKAFQDVSSNPSGTPERISLLSKAGAFADTVNNTYSSLVQLQKDVNAQISQTVTDINSLTSNIADLNVKIGAAENIGQNANDLRDKRGQYLNDLAEKINIQFYEGSGGQISVIGAGSALLVDKGSSWNLGVTNNADNNGYYNVVCNPSGSNSTDITSSISNGKLKGLITIRDTTTSGVIDKLDRFAASVANEVNQLHRGGFGLDGSTGVNLFTPASEAGDAASVSAESANSNKSGVAVSIDDPSKLTYQNYELTFSSGSYIIKNKSTNNLQSNVYADPSVFTFEGLSFNITGAHADGDTFSISAHKEAAKNLTVALTTSETDKIAAATVSTNNRGDNGNAIAMSQLQDKLSIDGDSSFNGYYSSIVGAIGADSQYASSSFAAQDFSMKQIKNMRESVSGVSLDEEMTNIMKFQRAYEASARLITIGDELLQTLIGMVK